METILKEAKNKALKELKDKYTSLIANEILHNGTGITLAAQFQQYQTNVQRVEALYNSAMKSLGLTETGRVYHGAKMG